MASKHIVRVHFIDGYSHFRGAINLHEVESVCALNITGHGHGEATRVVMRSGQVHELSFNTDQLISLLATLEPVTPYPQPDDD
ncbi:MAG: hypothetical protein ACPG8W_17955 [Candidatus Promineifilaceae bacterium]